MDKLKTEGVEFTSDGAQHNRQGNVWGAAIGGGLGGGLIGYAIGQNAKRNNYMHQQPQPYYPYPYPPQPHPYYGSSCGCSENQLVNRYELQQAERAEKLEAELAKEKAERYADGIGIATFKEVVAYFDKNMERRDRLSADLAAAVANLDKESAVNSEKLNCLRDKIAATEDAVVTLGKTTARNIASCKAEVENWANQRFVQQPKLRLCCGTPTWECASSESLDD
jgi:hypothetical protein